MPVNHVMEIFLTGIVDDLNQFVENAMGFNAEVDLSEELVVDIREGIVALARHMEAVARIIRAQLRQALRTPCAR